MSSVHNRNVLQVLHLNHLCPSIASFETVVEWSDVIGAWYQRVGGVVPYTWAIQCTPATTVGNRLCFVVSWLAVSQSQQPQPCEWRPVARRCPSMALQLHRLKQLSSGQMSSVHGRSEAKLKDPKLFQPVPLEKAFVRKRKACDTQKPQWVRSPRLSQAKKVDEFTGPRRRIAEKMAGDILEAAPSPQKIKETDLLNVLMLTLSLAVVKGLVAAAVARGKLWPALLVAVALPWWQQVALKLFVPPPGIAPQAWDVSHRHQLVEGPNHLDSKMRGVSESSLLRRAESAQDGAAQAAANERSQLVQAWGVVGVILYLSYGVFKVVPIVLDGLGAISEPWQWGLLAVTLLFFAYVEGYRGFQLGFSPRVVSRAWVVSEEIEEAPVWHKVLAAWGPRLFAC
eukprot:s285_g29.t1